MWSNKMRQDWFSAVVLQHFYHYFSKLSSLRAPITRHRTGSCQEAGVDWVLKGKYNKGRKTEKRGNQRGREPRQGETCQRGKRTEPARQDCLAEGERENESEGDRAEREGREWRPSRSRAWNMTDVIVLYVSPIWWEVRGPKLSWLSQPVM